MTRCIRLTFGLCELHEDGGAEVALLVLVREVVLGDAVGGVVDQGADVLPVSGVLALAVNPDAVILKIFLFYF